MPSPFPGMDPYVELSRKWGDFHTALLGCIRGQLNARLPSRFVAAVEEYVLLYEPKTRKSPRRVEPDAFLAERSADHSAGGVATVTAPLTIVLPSYQRKKRRNVEIVDQESRRVVAAIEVLSPANKKKGEDRQAYLQKRDLYLAARTNLVEIDLLRGGRRLPLSDPPPEILDYYVMVCSGWEYPQAGFWTFGIHDGIPEVPIPLTEDVPPTPLALRPCIDRVYDEGRYATELHYDRPVTPRLSKRDEDWARDLLAARKP